MNCEHFPPVHCEFTNPAHAPLLCEKIRDSTDLADCAIEVVYLRGLLAEVGYPMDDLPTEACTDSKSAYDLCHRYTSSQHSRHVDRKMFKMRELRGLGVVTVRHIPGTENPADMFTKLLKRQVFEKHRKVVCHFPGDTAAELGHRSKAEKKTKKEPTPQ